MSAPIYTDTSLLVSLYLADSNSPAALAAVAAAGCPLILTKWQQFELENAFHLRVFRKASSPADLAFAESRLAADVAAGLLVEAALSTDAVVPLARQLAARHSASLGTRAFDIFHVACALHLRAARFLSFDVRQLALARAAGLRTKP